MTLCPSPRSWLPSALAWVMLLTGALCAGLALLQCLGGWALAQSGERQAMLADPDMGQGLPGFLLRHWWSLMALSAAVAAGHVAVGVALLKRRPWSRHAAQAVLIAWLVGHLALLCVQELGLPGGAPGLAIPLAELADIGPGPWLRGLSWGLNLSLAAALGWLAWRLHAPDLVGEFRPQPQGPGDGA